MLIKKIFLAVILLAVFFAPPAIGKGAGLVFTLSDEDLMALDVYQDNNPKYDTSAPKITAKRDVSGLGVEFDIYFPPDNKNKSNYVLSYVSCKNRGNGELTDIDVNDFDAFALKFTLIAIDGKNDIETGGELVVGAIINSGYSHGFRPEYLSFAKNEAVSISKTDAEKTEIIGFTIYKSSPDGWSPQGNTVTIQVEAAPNAQIP